ncbi:malonate transporter subunit MadL [Tuberibacillus sp. Marseille-P3662]|uniref:malonate transporter subunit MadL n=1 Tax=Tuberibacillus sp. Marseille-P3662 TaxID=1965358 RepID=UPI000A1C82AD|nr:malonate transporter subunit MadL [Tuberibacillus sp. Marseille-P3662]
MVIYGVALLSICMLAGTFLGGLLGKIVGVSANVGGVGIAMLILVLLVDYLMKKNKLNKNTKEGLSFWSAIYIPIVVAMAAQQNVLAAVKGGPMAIMAGACAVAVSFVLVPILSKIGGNNSSAYENEEDEVI